MLSFEKTPEKDLNKYSFYVKYDIDSKDSKDDLMKIAQQIKQIVVKKAKGR